MRFILTAILLITSGLSHAGLYLDIDLNSRDQKGFEHSFKFSITSEMNKTSIMKVPDSNKIIEIMVTNKMPSHFPQDKLPKKDGVLVHLKLVELHDKKKTILANSQIVTVIGEEATMKTFDNNKKRIMFLKVKSTRI